MSNARYFPFVSIFHFHLDLLEECIHFFALVTWVVSHRPSPGVELLALLVVVPPKYFNRRHIKQGLEVRQIWFLPEHLIKQNRALRNSLFVHDFVVTFLFLLPLSKCEVFGVVNQVVELLLIRVVEFRSNIELLNEELLGLLFSDFEIEVVILVLGKH